MPRYRRPRRWLRDIAAVIGSALVLALVLVVMALGHGPSKPFRTQAIEAEIKRDAAEQRAGAPSATGPQYGPRSIGEPRTDGSTAGAASAQQTPPAGTAAPEPPAAPEHKPAAGPALAPSPQPLPQVLPQSSPAPTPMADAPERAEAVITAPPLPPATSPAASAEPAAPGPPEAASAPSVVPEDGMARQADAPAVQAMLLPTVPVPAPQARPDALPVQPAALVRPRLPSTPGVAELSVVIDDLGLDPRAARRAIELPAGVTLSFLPYGYQLDQLTAAAQARGHDVFLHMPMEPMGSEDPGPNALLTSLDPAEQQRRLAWAFDRLPRAVGLNNHMGSRATTDPALMLVVLREVQRRGLVFVDSRTTALTVAAGVAERLGVPHVSRDVFLDNDPSAAAIRPQLAEAERVARRHGAALAIGHPFPATLALLAEWLPEAERRGIRIVSARHLAGEGGCGLVAAAATAQAPC